MKLSRRLRPISFSLLILALMLAIGGGFYAAAHPASAQSGPGQQAIEIAAAQPDIAKTLTFFPHWSAEAEVDDPDENIWHVVFFQDQSQEDWLGEASVDLDDGSILEYYIPIFLTPEEEAQQRAEVEELVLSDEQILALLGNLDDWDKFSYYDPWEVVWRVQFEHGLDAWAADVRKNDDERWFIERIIDPYALTAEQKQRSDHDKAIELAAESNKVWKVLENIDNWSALSSPLTGDQWGVSIFTRGREIYYLRVDINAWRILEEGSVRSTTTTYFPYHVRH